MIPRPAPLRLLDSYFASARLAHEYADRLHRKLVELEAHTDHTRELVRESAALSAERMPALARRVRLRERAWEEQDLLDPPAAASTIDRLREEVDELLPQLAALHARQRRIVAELHELVTRAP